MAKAWADGGGSASAVGGANVKACFFFSLLQLMREIVVHLFRAKGV